MSNEVTIKDVVNEVARRQATSTVDVTHRALVQVFVKSTDARAHSSFDELVERMVPTFLTCRAADTTYDLTAEGWLESDMRSAVERVVDAYLQSYRAASPDVVGRLVITGKDLAANGVGDADAGLVWAVGRSFYLYQSGAFHKERDRVSLYPPADIDELLRLRSCEEVRAYRASRPRNRVEFVDAAHRSVTRDVRLVRDAIWSAFKTRREWPRTRDLDVQLSPKGVAIERVIAAHDLFIGGAVVSLSLRGLWLTPDASIEQDRVMRVMSALCDAYVSEDSRTFIRADELSKLKPEISEDDTRWVWAFLQYNMHFHVGTPGDAPAFNLVSDLLAFRGASSLEDALFNLSLREKPRGTGGRGNPLMQGLPFGLGGDESDVLDHEQARVSSSKLSSQVVVVAVPQIDELRIGPVPIPPPGLERDENTGARMGPWQVGERIGAGGFGKVYLAEHALAAVPVVIKAIALANEEDRERFKREANALGTLHHPGVPVVYDAGFHESDLGYIALERLHGADLQRLLNNGWRPSEDDVIAVVTQTLQILGLAHDHGILHRDIKPSNLFLVEAGGHRRLKVLDFGCAKLIGASKLTKTGGVVGTQIYQPPEALLSGRFEIPGDMWSLAVTAHELATGSHPFLGATQVEVLARIVAGSASPFDATRFPRLQRFVTSSLSVKADQRPQSAAEAVALLTQA